MLQKTYNAKRAEAVWWNLLLLTTGAFLVTVCVKSVASSHDMLMGGILGVSLLTWHVTQMLEPLIWYVIISIPIWIWGWFYVGRRFLLYTAYGTLVSMVLGFFWHYQIPVENEIYAAVIGGVLHGTGAGIMLRTLGSAGGTDVVAVMLKARWNIPIGQFSFAFNVLVFLAGSFLYKLDLIIASVIMMFISANTLEYVLGLFNRRKMALIISERGEEVCEAILATERFGVTLLRGKGAYSGTDKETAPSSWWKTPSMSRAASLPAATADRRHTARFSGDTAPAGPKRAAKPRFFRERQAVCFETHSVSNGKCSIRRKTFSTSFSFFHVFDKIRRKRHARVLRPGHSRRIKKQIALLRDGRSRLTRTCHKTRRA